MVYRVYVEKKAELANEANGLLSDARTFLGIDTLEKVRLFNRYDVENIAEELFNLAEKYSKERYESYKRLANQN